MESMQKQASAHFLSELCRVRRVAVKAFKGDVEFDSHFISSRDVDDLLNGKMNRKGLTYEETLEDIYNTAITTNETVTKTFHIGG